MKNQRFQSLRKMIRTWPVHYTHQVKYFCSSSTRQTLCFHFRKRKKENVLASKRLLRRLCVESWYFNPNLFGCHSLGTIHFFLLRHDLSLAQSSPREETLVKLWDQEGMEKAGHMSRQAVLPRVVFPRRLASAGALCLSGADGGGKALLYQTKSGLQQLLLARCTLQQTSLFGRFFPILFELEDYNLSFKRNKMS